jgi:hypothetical protein
LREQVQALAHTRQIKTLTANKLGLIQCQTSLLMNLKANWPLSHRQFSPPNFRLPAASLPMTNLASRMTNPLRNFLTKPYRHCSNSTCNNYFRACASLAPALANLNIFFHFSLELKLKTW